MLPLISFTLTLRFTTPAKLPYWLGSAFRGVFGYQIKKAVCSLPEETHLFNSSTSSRKYTPRRRTGLSSPEFPKSSSDETGNAISEANSGCSSCISKEDCLFYYLYGRTTATVGHAPPSRPLIIIPPFFGKEMAFKKDGYLKVGVRLLGDFRRYIPHILMALEMAGGEGIGSLRHYNINRFVLEKGVCDISNQQFFDGEVVNTESIASIDVGEVKPIEGNRIKVSFRTPIILQSFPPSFETLLHLTRNRLIRFVNEYGRQENVPDFRAEGDIVSVEKHFHILERRSSRSDKTTFKGYTGQIVYEAKNADRNARWLFGVGNMLGAGSDSSFGLGFYIAEKV